MKHSCIGIEKYNKMEGLDRPPHYLTPRLQDSPDNDGAIFTVVYSNNDDHVQLGCGMKLHFCPACGEGLVV